MRIDRPGLSLSSRRPARVTPAKLGVFVTSVIELALVPAALRRFGLAPVQAFLARPRCMRPARWSGDLPDPARQIARLVDRAARCAPAVNCLARSVVLWGALRRRGLPAELRIGVGPTTPRDDIHCWVESRDTVLNDGADVATRYRPFARPIGPTSDG